MRVAILIPCYNEAPTIGACLDSCLAQSRRADDIIVVNDGSTDESLAVLESYGEQITVLNLSKNSGKKAGRRSRGLSI